MAIPPADPADLAEQRRSATAEADPPVATAQDALATEADEGDLAEQSRLAQPDADPISPDLPLDADPADVAEQHAAVPVEDDDRRA